MRSGLRDGRLRAHLLSARDRGAALQYLDRHRRENLLLAELVAGVGRSAAPSELPPQVIAVWRGREIAGIASLRPSMVLDHDLDEEGLEACLPLLGGAETGLIKSGRCGVARLWQHLASRGRKAMIDRGETAWGIAAEALDTPRPALPEGARWRRANDADLDDLVFAARASLREEDRPDPFDGDPVGFRRWVRGRLSRARLVDVGGRPVFVGYADVRRPEGWLIQGVYTWREHRRRGFARAGMAALVGEAFDSGAEHVQLAVVDGNEPAIGLYSGLGFEPFCELRTILFL
jgi:ribosomal protein S18 acetylase RimI-like enzyme